MFIPSILVQELFCVCGALKRARLLKVGIAEVVFVRKDDAINAYRKYNNRCLDGEALQPFSLVVFFLRLCHMLPIQTAPALRYLCNAALT